MTLTHADILAMPKVVLHDHLDGGLRASTLVELASAIDHELPGDTPEAVKRAFNDNAASGDLVRYLEAFAHTTAVMQTAESLTRIAREAVEDHAADGVIYAELRYAPELHVAGGLSLQEVVEAVQAGIEEGVTAAVEAGHPIRAAALLCGMRQADRVAEIAQLALDNRGTCCVGFDIAGPEAGFRPSAHRDAFQLLREALMPVTIHAGEADGAESITEALGLGSARRIGHGTRVHEDIEGLDTDEPVLGVTAQDVLDRQIPLECCPTSNVQTAAAPSIAEHPIHALRDLGFAVTINTDNRLVSGVSMSSEFAALAEAGWTAQDFFEATLTAAWNAFLQYDERADLADLVVQGYGMDEA